MVRPRGSGETVHYVALECTGAGTLVSRASRGGPEAWGCWEVPPWAWEGGLAP